MTSVTLSPEEEFVQLYGHQKAPKRIPNMVKKAGSRKWGGPVPPSCDWRKATNIISSIKNQVSAQPTLAGGGGGMRSRT